MHIDRVIPLKISSTVLRLTETNIVIKLMPQLLTVKLSYACFEMYILGIII